jgi:hypothetical protein
VGTLLLDIPRGIYNEKMFAASLNYTDPNMFVDQPVLGGAVRVEPEARVECACSSVLETRIR